MKPINSPSSSGFILIVDDHPINVKVAESILTSEGFQTHSLNESQGVVDWVAKNQPDLVLMDILMPELSGLETCSRLKARPATSGIPVIFLTAKGGTDSLVQGFNAGGVDYITKPFQSEELIARVQAHVTIQHLQRNLNTALDELQHQNRRLEESLSQIAKLKDAMLRICAWTKQVNVDGKWINIDDYLTRYLGLQLTHGISDEGLSKILSLDTPEPSPSDE